MNNSIKNSCLAFAVVAMLNLSAAEDRKLYKRLYHFLSTDQPSGYAILGLPSTATDYEVLGVAPTATPKEIRKAYLEKLLKFHPDKYRVPGAVEATKVLVGAYSRLSGRN